MMAQQPVGRLKQSVALPEKVYPYWKRCTHTRKSLLLWREFVLFIGRVLVVRVPSLLHKIVSYLILTGRGYSKHLHKCAALKTTWSILLETGLFLHYYPPTNGRKFH